MKYIISNIQQIKKIESQPNADRLPMKRSCEFPGSGFNIT